MNFLDARLPDRFWDKVAPEPNSGCWLWIGATDPNGYARFRLNGTTHLGHRVSYGAVRWLDDRLVLETMLFKCPACGESARDYEALDSHVKLAPVNGQCERCHLFDVSEVLRGKRLAIEDGRGDYMREQMKDRPW